MGIAFFIMAILLSAKINGYIMQPWWLVVVSMFAVFFVGLFISGRVKIKFIKED